MPNSTIATAIDVTRSIQSSPFEYTYTLAVDALVNITAWSATASYIAGDVVQQASTVYKCILAHTNQIPPNATYWSVAVALDYVSWFKYIAQPDDVVVAVMAYATSGGHTGYRPKIKVWLGPESAPVHYEPSGQANEMIAGHNEPMVVPIQPGSVGRTYYFQVLPDAFSTAPFPNLNFRVTQGPREAVPDDAMVIVNDVAGYPGVYVDPDDGHILRYVWITQGEFGDRLPSGVFAMTNDDTSDPLALLIYSAQRELIATVPLTNAASTGNLSVKAVGTQYFYVSQKPNASADTTLRKVSSTGQLTQTWVFVGNAFNIIAINETAQILYYATHTAIAGAIHRHNLATDTPMTDLVAGVASHTVYADLFVLTDGTILATYHNTLQLAFARLYAADGTTIRTYTYTPPLSRTEGPRTSWDGADTFWLWASGSNVAGDRISHLTHYRISTGAVLAEFDVPLFTQGLGPAGSGNDPTVARFGNSESCPVLKAGPILLTPFATLAGSDGCPCPSPTANNPGDIVPEVEPESWIPNCVGGGTVPTQADLTDSEDWSL